MEPLGTLEPGPRPNGRSLERARRLIEFGKSRNPLPQGTLPVGAGLLIAGLTAYGFLVISARALGPQRYASLSVLWALAFLFNPGFFLPLEQEVSRALSARRAGGIGGAPLVTRAVMLGAALSAAVVAACLLAAGFILDRLFDGEVMLLVAFAISLLVYFAAYLTRGILSGEGQFRRYGLVVGTEGVLRLTGCVGLALFGVAAAGPYGLALALAPIGAVAIGLRGVRELILPGPPAPWGELSSALAYLLAASFLAQLLVNAGPVAVKLLAAPSQSEAAGRFLAGLVIARVPLFLFQAVQAALLPKLSGFAAAGLHAEFRSGVRRILVAVTAIGAVATLAALSVGPWGVRLLFGREFVLSRVDLGYLAGASAAYMVAIALAQALIALESHARVAIGWLIGTAVFFLVTAFGTDLLTRVEHGFLAGSVGAALAMGALLAPRLAGREAAPVA